MINLSPCFCQIYFLQKTLLDFKSYEITCLKIPDMSEILWWSFSILLIFLNKMLNLKQITVCLNVCLFVSAVKKHHGHGNSDWKGNI